ncbi:MAG: molybdate ABC transporter substrate-binding protein [Rhizobiaceae bacterium]
MPPWRITWPLALAGWFFAVCSSLFALGLPVSAADRILVFCASSLTDVMSEIGRGFQKQSGVKVSFSFASTGQLAQQIEAGAPADVFVSADNSWTDWVVDKTVVERGDVTEFAGNRLVIAVRQEVENWVNIEALLTTTRFAMGEPESVPAGGYAVQSLQKRGLWKSTKAQAVYGENVRVALRKLALGEVSAALVYATDVNAESGVRALYTFPENSHDAIVYSAAPVTGSNAAASDFVAYLASDEAKVVLKKFGFSLPGATN